MKTRCPACGASFSLDVLIAHDGAREAVNAAGKLPAPMFPLLLQYVGLFRPRKNALSMDRVAKLFNELLGPITEHRVHYNGTDWPATDEMWIVALSGMVTRARNGGFDLPLDNHNYLFKVVSSFADKEAAQKETKLELDRKNGGFGRGDGFVSVGTAVAEIANRTPEGKAQGLAAMKAALNKEKESSQ